MNGYWNNADAKSREEESRGYADGYDQKPLKPDASEAFIRGWKRATAIVGEPSVKSDETSQVVEEPKKPVALF